MITDNDLHELLQYQAPSPVLSLYLNIEPVEGGVESHRKRLRSMLKEIDMPEDVFVVERYFEHEFDWSGKSVVVFSCQAEDFFRGYPLALPVRSRVRLGNRPHVKPLADLLDAYGGYGVALIDKQAARLFDFHLGELREEEGVQGEAVRHTKRGGGSQAQGRRGGTAGQTDYVEEVADRNIKEAAEAAARFFTEKGVRRVIIGGTEDNVTPFQNQLPKAWQSLVVGTFPISMTASKDDVLERAIQIVKEADTRRDAKLVDAVITGAAKGRGAVVQLENTLRAVHDGRVQTLLIKESFREKGYRCTGCGYVTSVEIGKCPYCGGKFDQISDVVELAVRKVMTSGGEVEVLHDDLGLGDYEHIGAILRY